MTRYLAHAVLHAGTVYRHAVVSLEGTRLSIDRFERELHSTVFISGFIVVAAAEKLRPADSNLLKRLVRRDDLVEMSLKRLSRYLDGHDLYVTATSDTPVLLMLER